jgi:hypothetical protein
VQITYYRNVSIHHKGKKEECIDCHQTKSRKALTGHFRRYFEYWRILCTGSYVPSIPLVLDKIVMAESTSRGSNLIDLLVNLNLSCNEVAPLNGITPSCSVNFRFLDDKTLGIISALPAQKGRLLFTTAMLLS